MTCRVRHYMCEGFWVVTYDFDATYIVRVDGLWGHETHVSGSRLFVLKVSRGKVAGERGSMGNRV